VLKVSPRSAVGTAEEVTGFLRPPSPLQVKPAEQAERFSNVHAVEFSKTGAAGGRA
jgi:hypothetical protein